MVVATNLAILFIFVQVIMRNQSKILLYSGLKYCVYIHNIDMTWKK